MPGTEFGLTGSPAQCIESIRRFVDIGATTITLRPVGYHLEGQYRRVSEEVLPAFRVESSAPGDA